MPFLLTERVALVTGAGRGIGRTTALILAEAGWDLVLVGRDCAASFGDNEATHLPSATIGRILRSV